MKSMSSKVLVSVFAISTTVVACGGGNEAKAPSGDAHAPAAAEATTKTPAAPEAAPAAPVAAAATGTTTTASAGTTTSEPAAGESLKDKERWAELTKEIDEKASKASTACGTTMKASFDTASFKGLDIQKGTYLSMCRDVLNTLPALCAKDPGKAAVKKGVSSVTCRNATDGTKVTRQGNELVVHIDSKNTAIVGAKKGSYSWKSALEEIL